MSTISTILLSDEPVQWTSRQKHAVLLTHTAIGLLITYIIAQFISSLGVSECTVNNRKTTCDIGKYAFWVYVFGFGSTLWFYATHRVVVYYLTTKRVIIESGLIGRDFKSIYFEQIQSCDVNVGLVDKLFGTGSISLDTGKVKTSKEGNKALLDTLAYIEAPYDVYKNVQEILRSYKESLYK